MRTRNKQIVLRFTEEALKHLDDMASKTIFSREQFIREMLAGYKIKASPPAPLWETVCLLRRVASDIRTIESHSRFKEVSDIELLRKSIKDIRTCLDDLTPICMPTEEFEEETKKDIERKRKKQANNA